jgi:hypothetical protein
MWGSSQYLKAPSQEKAASNSYTRNALFKIRKFLTRYTILYCTVYPTLPMPCYAMQNKPIYLPTPL